MHIISKIVLSVGTLSIASLGFALDCPKAKLTCTVRTVNLPGVVSSEVLFNGVNDDEPSLPANECKAYLSIDSKTSKQRFVASLDGTDEITGYFYIGKEFGALDPQFSTQMIVGQKVTISYNQQYFECELSN